MLNAWSSKMFVKIVCLLVIVVVHADPENCPEIVANFPKKCNDLNLPYKNSCVTCEQCAKNASSIEEPLKNAIRSYIKQNEIFAKNWEPIIKKLTRQFNNRVRTGPWKCQKYVMPNVPQNYIDEITEVCGNIRYNQTPDEINNVIEDLEDAPEDEARSKCLCSYAVPYINNVCNNAHKRTKAIKNCDLKKVFRKLYETKWLECKVETTKNTKMTIR